MAKVIMVQGTMSNAGKSLLVAGLCRIFRQDGYRVAPFKSQNMALNSFITTEGLEMGRAQVMQAEAAGIEPSVRMNPILLKPTSDVGSQVIVNGEVRQNMRAAEYFKYKKSLIPDIMAAYNSLAAENDIIVVEGAGSPAEINLKSEDIVNMGLAKMLKAPVLLAGDIDRGGVFAQLVGTMMLLEKEEQQMVKGLIINKFRGDKRILDPGIEMLKDYTPVPVVGVVPYMHVDIDDDFAKNVKPGDIMVAEANFGCGSSREHAPIAIKASGISCVIASTFARIFYRNAINIGLAILECDEAARDIKANDEVEVDFDSGVITNITTGKTYQAQPFPPFIQNIIKNGGLMNSIK